MFTGTAIVGQVLIFACGFNRIESESISRTRKADPHYFLTLRSLLKLDEYASHTTGLSNAVFSTIYAICCIVGFTEWKMPAACIAYFLYDMKTARPTHVAHHLLGLFLIFFSEMEPVLAPYLLLTEFSTIFLCLRGQLKGVKGVPRTMRVSEKKLVKLYDKAFFASFIITRLIILPYAALQIKSGVLVVPAWTLFGINLLWAARYCAKHM